MQLQSMKNLYCEKCYDSNMDTLSRCGARWLCGFCAPDATPTFEEPDEADGSNEDDEEEEPENCDDYELKKVVLLKDVVVVPGSPADQPSPPPSPTMKRRASFDEASDILRNMRKAARSEEDDSGTWFSEPGLRDWQLPWQLEEVLAPDSVSVDL